MAKQENNRMRVSLPVSGLDTSTPDQTVADGKCEELHNLRWESGSWHNIDPLKIKSRLSPTAGQEALFEKLTIIYHHPAAGDDAYIASIPNADGTIDLHQVNLPNDHPEDGLAICNIYFVQENAADGIPILGLVSSKPVASDCGVEFTCKSSSSSKIEESDHFILTGETKSIDKIQDAILVDITRTWPEKDDTYRYRFYKSQDEILSNKRFAQNIPADIRITHFGNVLIVTDPTNKRVIHYYLNNGSYEEFQIPRPPVVRQSEIFSLTGQYQQDGQTIKCTGISQYRANDLTNGVPFYNISTGVFYISQVSAEYFWGEICYFAAFQMSDGSLVAPSALSIAAAEPFAAGEQFLKYYSGDAIYKMRNCSLYTREIDNEKVVMLNGGTGNAGCTPFSFWIRPYITLTIPKNLNTLLITSVNIYSTRINPIWNSEKFNQLNVPVQLGGSLIPDYWADNRLPEQPFYFVKSIPIDDFTNGEHSMYLGGDLLKDIEQNTAYEPVDTHSLFYDVATEYNSRLHISGNLATKLFDGYGSDFFPATDTSPVYSLLTDVRIDDVDYSAETPSTGFLQDETQLVLNKILSYPDSRATLIYSPGNDAGDGYRPYSIKLQSATANNFAWAVYGRDRHYVSVYLEYYVKYSAAFYKAMQEDKYRDGTGPGLPINSPAYVPQRNKLRVSAPNNPFSFPLANSYAIGTENNRIHAINSAAIEMSDAKFGEFPLFVFTEEGIFTLQSGSGEVLYSATIPLNYDRIVNPATLAVNHNVLYVTARGIMAMFSNESRLISEPINNLHNTPPLDYLRTAKMCYQPAHNEVIVWNPAHAIGRAVAGTRAYVFSLDGGYWSTRDLEGVKLNTDELVVHTSNQFLVLDLSEEEARSGQSVRIRLVTRPLKFGSTEFKRLETFVARLHTQSPQSLRLFFEGSSDLKTWITLRDTGFFRTDRDTLLRRFPGSIRFLRVTLEADLDAGFELAQFDAEYYTRFLHRLR